MAVELERVDVVDGQVPLPGMPEDGVLFHVEPLVPTDAAHGDLSPDRRRTLRQRTQVERGIHPLTGGTARAELGTCGGCVHRLASERAYPKCALGPATRGPGTDVRAWWPACDRFEARP